MRFPRVLTALFCLSFTACTALCGRAETFRNPVRIPVGTDPASVIVGDLNGDGLGDILWGDTTTTPARLHVLLAQKAGGYTPAPDLVLPANTVTWCRLFDANGDGRLDLVCPQSSAFQASLLLFLGNGDGTFGAPTSTQLPTSNGNFFYPLIVPPADLNGDGILDLAVIDELNNRTYTLLGDGHANFRLVSTPINGAAEFVTSDINGDGKPDLLFPSGPSVALGNGDGTFGPFHSYAQSAYYGATCVYADVEGIGHVDAICGYLKTNGMGDITGGSALIVLHGNPDGSFNTTPIASQNFGDQTNAYNGFGTFQFPIAMKDVNGDGILDIIAYAGDGYSVLLGGPGLHYSYPTHYAAGYFSGTVGNGYSDRAVQYADMDGDGLPDIVAEGPNGIYISYARRDGTYSAAPAYEATPVIGYSVVADFNGDGIPDIVASGYQNLEISLGKGDGTFASYSPLPRGNIDFSTPLSSTNAHILHGDFNGDGKQDIIAIGSSAIYQNNSYLLFGHGDGTFDPPLLVTSASALYPLNATYADAAIVDVNRDGRDDILGLTTNVLGGPQAQLYILRSNGDGTFTPITTTVPADPVPNSPFTYAATFPALADFNGDGKLDAVYGGLSNLYMVLGHGDGTFDSTGVILPIPSLSGVPSKGAIAVATGDFDGDGRQDFAVLVQYIDTVSNPFVAPNSSALFVYYGNGDGTFSAPVTAGIFNRSYTSVAAADLNLDGRSDLILKTDGTLAGGHAVGIVHALAGRAFGPEINYAAGTGLSSLSIADLNRDGFPDLILANGDFNIRASSVTVLLNEGNTPAVTGTLAASPEPSTFGQAFTLTASLIPPSPATLAGTIAFSIDGISVGSAALASNTASIVVPGTFAVGTHVLAATWPGDSTFLAVMLSGTHTVVGLPSSTVLTAAPNPALALQPVTLTATVSGASLTPTGSVTFYDGATSLGSAALDSTGHASIVTSSLAVGTHSLTAVYAGNTTYSTSTSAAFSETINAIPTSTTLTVSPTPAQAFQFFTVTAQVASSNSTTLSAQPCAPNCTVTFTIAGLPPNLPSTATAPVLANGTATARYAFAVGTYTFSATFNGSTIFAASTATPIQQTVIPATTTLSLTGSPNPASQSQTVNLAGTLTAPLSSESPSGTMTYLDGTTPIGTAPFTGSALANSTSATLPINTLAPGTHIITVSYAGSTNFLASTSAPITLTILPQDFTITLANPTITIQTQHHTTTTVTLASLNGFADSLALGCVNPPTYVTCRFTPTSTPLAANATATVSLYLDTDSVLGYARLQSAPPLTRPAPSPITLALLLSPFGLFGLVAATRRNNSRRLTHLRLFLFLLAVIPISAALTGCGQIIYPYAIPPSATPGTYNIQIVASGASTGLTHTANLTLQITP